MNGYDVVSNVARELLTERTGKFHFSLTETDAIINALRVDYPGHLIPGLMEERQKMIADEEQRVREVLRHVVRIVGLAQEKLADGP